MEFSCGQSALFILEWRGRNGSERGAKEERIEGDRGE